MERLPDPWGGPDETVFGPMPLELVQLQVLDSFHAVLKDWGTSMNMTTRAHAWLEDAARVLATSRYLTHPAPCGPDCEITMNTATERVP